MHLSELSHASQALRNPSTREVHVLVLVLDHPLTPRSPPDLGCLQPYIPTSLHPYKPDNPTTLPYIPTILQPYTLPIIQYLTTTSLFPQRLPCSRSSSSSSQSLYPSSFLFAHHAE